MATSPYILIIEDDAANRDFIHLVVNRYFPTAVVTTAPSGYDGLVAYQEHNADLLILDHYLPDVLGNTLISYLRDAGVTAPILLMSGLLPREAATTDERTYFMPKPLGLTEFLATITNALTATRGVTSTA